MNYTFNNEVPIYLQIVDIIANDIVSGKIKPGEKILSVREYAALFKANPNTICKALSVLEDNLLIYTERTNGKFVTTDLEVIKSYKDRIFNEKVSEFLVELKSMGYNNEEIIKKMMEVCKWV